MEELTDEDIDTLLFESWDHMSIIIRARDDALLIALADKDAGMNIVLQEMQRTVHKIRDI